MILRAILGGAALFLISFPFLHADSFRVTKSLSGPSGKVVGNKFVFDETRSRFVFPQDKSLTVYFEWQAPIGEHTLIASWKAPDGRVVSISPDVRVQTKNTDLNAYWQFLIAPGIPSGVWTCEVRIDGEPAGSLSFELVVPQNDHASEPPAPAQPEHPTMDQIYSKVSPSLVWVYAIDADGTRLDTSDGFVYGPNVVATSFSAIDSATHLEIEFANGRRVKTDDVIVCSRLQDWALLRIDTGTTPALPLGNPADVKIGDRLPSFNVQNNKTREFGGIDISGRQNAANPSSQILFNPNLTAESAGGPLLDLDGKVVAILGGSLTPGGRFHHKDVSMSSALFNSLGATRAAIPVTLLPKSLSAESKSLSELMAGKVFTRPLMPGPSFLWGGMTNKAPKNLNLPPPDFKTEFRKNEDITVMMNWQKREKNGKGILSAEIYDASNRLLGTVAGKKFTLSEMTPTQLTFGFSPAPLTPGIYRIDVLWNDQAVWRTFFTMVE